LKSSIKKRGHVRRKTFKDGRRPSQKKGKVYIQKWRALLIKPARQQGPKNKTRRKKENLRKRGRK